MEFRRKESTSEAAIKRNGGRKQRRGKLEKRKTGERLRRDRGYSKDNENVKFGNHDMGRPPRNA